MITIYFDGSIAPVNPGGTAWGGARIEMDGEVIHEISKKIGSGPLMSSNVAEYGALNFALTYLINNGLENERVEVFGDSQLVINAMNKKNGINYGLCKPYSIKCRELIKRFSNLELFWIPREQNSDADILSKCGSETNS